LTESSNLMILYFLF